MHAIDRLEPSIGHVQSWPHLANHFQCFASSFKALAQGWLGRVGLLARIG
jgi:hypothetical protein